MVYLKLHAFLLPALYFKETGTGIFMKEIKQTREQLEKRRDEINKQLHRVNDDLRIELERDEEEQAIQLEQDEVSMTMEANLRKELSDIEDKLLDFEN